MASYEVEMWTAACACGRARVLALFKGQFLHFTMFLFMKGDAAFPRGHVAKVEGLFALFRALAPFVGDTLCRSKKFQELLPARA